MDLDHELEPASRIAVAWQPTAGRAALAAMLALDARLGRLVAQAREPVLAQMRLAWWRERLTENAGARPGGEPVLAAIGHAWPGFEGGLVALVDGWEELLGDAPLDRTAIERFAAGRMAAVEQFCRIAAPHRIVKQPGRRWAYGDLAARTRDTVERSLVRAVAGGCARPARLPKSLRGIAVLDALGARALAHGGPLLAGRGAALAAYRVGLIGR